MSYNAKKPSKLNYVHKHMYVRSGSWLAIYKKAIFLKQANLLQTDSLSQTIIRH